MAQVATAETPKHELLNQRKSLEKQLSQSVDDQVELINQQIQVENALTKQEVAQQKESIARLKADLADECCDIGLKILRCGDNWALKLLNGCRQCLNKHQLLPYRHVLSENDVPKSAFHGAKGVLLMQAAFAAAGMTAFRGEGFVVAWNGGQWSAPAFIRLSSVGMGFALGGECGCCCCCCVGAPLLCRSALQLDQAACPTGEMGDTIAILHKDEDVLKYKKGNFGWHAYMTGSPLEAEHSMSKEAHPFVYTARSGTLLNYSLNGAAGQHCHDCPLP